MKFGKKNGFNAIWVFFLEVTLSKQRPVGIELSESFTPCQFLRIRFIKTVLSRQILLNRWPICLKIDIEEFEIHMEKSIYYYPVVLYSI